MNPQSTGLNSSRIPTSILQTVFKIPTFRDDQLQIVLSILGGQDHLIIKATGFGKSICYQVPGIISMSPVVVITPIIALIDDQVANLVGKGISAGGIHSGMSKVDRQNAISRMAAGKMRFIYLSPEMFNFGHIQKALIKAGVQTVVVDEAHCISQWGSDFRPAYSQIGPVVKSIEKSSGKHIQTLAFTATATSDVKQDILDKLNINQARIIVGSNRRENLCFRVLRAKNKNEAGIETLSLLSKCSGPIIIYCLTIKNIEFLSSILTEMEIPHSIYHGKLDIDERSQTQADFIDGTVRVIIATDAFGMGIDKKDVRLVINFGLPMSLEHYIQQAGRAGRDGEYSECVLISQPGDKFIHDLFLSSQYICPETTMNVYNLLCKSSEKYYPSSLSALLSNVLRPMCGDNKRLIYNALSYLKSVSAIKITKVQNQWKYFIPDKSNNLEISDIQRLNRNAGNKSSTMFSYADQANTCLHVYMEQYLYDTKDQLKLCGKCSVCVGIPIEFGLPQTSILRCIQDTGRVYGLTQLKLILKGEFDSLSPSAKKHANIPSFGSLSNMNFDDIGHMIKEMIAAQYLSRPNNIRAGIVDTQKGVKAMNEFIQKNPNASIAAGGPPLSVKASKILDRLRGRLASLYDCQKNEIWTDTQNSILADCAPSTLSELKELEALSGQQLAVYGEHILSALKNLTTLKNSTNL